MLPHGHQLQSLFDAADALSKADMTKVSNDNDAEVEFEELLINWM